MSDLDHGLAILLPHRGVVATMVELPAGFRASGSSSRLTVLPKGSCAT